MKCTIFAVFASIAAFSLPNIHAADDLAEQLVGDSWAVLDDRHSSQDQEAQLYFSFQADGNGTLLQANLKAKPEQITRRASFSWSVGETIGNACVLTIKFKNDDGKPTTMLLAFDGADTAIFQRDEKINFLVRIKQKRAPRG